MASIELQDVGLTFRVRQRGRVTLKEFVLKGLFLKSVNPIWEVHALNNINLSLKTGDRLGIIGRNGAGKSTLLKVLAGVYPPGQGKRIVEGRISSLFEIALGFEHEATGWENINFRAYLHGETPQSLKPKIQSIAEFSELGEFLNMPLRYYSAGMLMRLAFAVSTSIEPEILLIDEVLSVGDLGFQAKARMRMREMLDRAQLIIMVSHDLVSLAQVCDRVLWLEHGYVRQIGPAAEVIQAYTEHVQPKQPLAA